MITCLLVGRDEILKLQILNKLYLAITSKTFHSEKVGSLFCTARILLGEKDSHVIASAQLIGMKKVIKTLVWSNPWQYISIDYSYFFCIFMTHMTLICEKEVNKCPYRISSFSEYFYINRILWVFVNKYTV